MLMGVASAGKAFNLMILLFGDLLLLYVLFVVASPLLCSLTTILLCLISAN